MCGIVGYTGTKNAVPILLEGLKALEYRGYDSAGIAVFSPNGVVLEKRAGRVGVLESALASRKDIHGTSGIAHTRWATHGVPNEANAHPHQDCGGRIFVAHNGVIENYKEIKSFLEGRGHVFTSDTDTETIPHLIEEFLKEHSVFKTALMNALAMIRGAYALAIADAENPGTIYAVRFSSPLVVGKDGDEYFLASDPAALVGHVHEVVYLKDGEVAELSSRGIQITDIRMQPLPTEVVELEWNLEQAQKGNFPHFMLKEIFEGPEVVRAALRGRLRLPEGAIRLGGIEKVDQELRRAKRILILACGTSYYAGLVGEYFFEEIAGIPCEVHLASEFRYRDEPFEPGTVAIAISQSGETADTLAALRRTKSKNLLTLGIVNVVGSTIARETDAGIYNHAGPEIGVASTKAFLSQLTVLALLAMKISRTPSPQHIDLIRELENIPSKMEAILTQSKMLEAFAGTYTSYENFLFLGRRYSYPVALEGALKLKEVSYIHAEGYGAGEMKHGPIAMVSPDFPVVAVVPQNSISEKMYTNMEEIRARSGRIFSIATKGDSRAAALSDDVFFIPPTLEPLEPFLAVVPLQLFAYWIGVKRGYDVDKPRNLAKSVTVE